MACQEELARFFAIHPDPSLHKRVTKALRLVANSEIPLAGRPQGWAAGAIYAVANLDRPACGIPGLLNSEVTEFFGVSMETIRRRAARVVSGISV